MAWAMLGFSPPRAARAGETFLVTGDVGGARLLAEPQASLFGMGATGALGIYRPSQTSLLTGLRLRIGVFADGPPPADKGRADPGVGSSGSALLALRWRPLNNPAATSLGSGLWLEGGAGGGLDGTLLRPMAEVGFGWGFAFGSLAIGPAVRYHRVVHFGAGDDGNDAQILLFGLEVGGGAAAAAAPPGSAGATVAAGPAGTSKPGAVAAADNGPRRSTAVPQIAAPPKAPRDTDDDGVMDADDRCPGKAEDVDGFEDSDGCPDDDDDRDGILDLFDKCRLEPETVNGINDEDGCPDKGLITLVGDRIVLEDGIMFQTGRAQLSAGGRKLLEAVANLCRQHLEWEQLAVEGHTDARGSIELNQRLSEDRANGVRKGLLDLGFDDKKVTARGFGATRPRATGDDEEAHRRNRRVELVVIHKKVTVPAASGRPAEPTLTPPPVASSAAAPVAPSLRAPQAVPPGSPPGVIPIIPPRPTPAPRPAHNPAESLDTLDEQAH